MVLTITLNLKYYAVIVDYYHLFYHQLVVNLDINEVQMKWELNVLQDLEQIRDKNQIKNHIHIELKCKFRENLIPDALALDKDVEYPM